ncbi:MAG: dephospho-CoA kinase [Balneolales bacterium]
MIQIGITGGIGSGKTTVCSIWERLGARVVYADALAKSLMVENKELHNDIIKVFGEQTFNNDGSLNRSWLAKEAFEGKRVKELNRLVHPWVYQELEKLKKKAEKEGIEIFVRESALLLDNGRPDDIDAVILLKAPESKRIEWVVQRDLGDEAHVRERIQNQQDYSRLEPLADIVLENDDSKEKLEKKAEIIFRELTAVAK